MTMDTSWLPLVLMRSYVPILKSCSRSLTWLSKRDDKDAELQATQTALERAKEDAVTDIQAAKEARQELISQHEEMVRTLEEQVDECRRRLEKQEVQYELARLQLLGGATSEVR